MLYILTLFLHVAAASDITTGDLAAYVRTIQSEHASPIAILTQNQVSERALRDLLGPSEGYRFAYAGSATEAPTALRKEGLACGLYIAKAQYGNWDVVGVGTCPAVQIPSVSLAVQQGPAVCANLALSTSPAKEAERFINMQIASGKTQFLTMTGGPSLAGGGNAVLCAY